MRDPHVWARTGDGRLRRMLRSAARAEGLEFEDIAEDGELEGVGCGANTPHLSAHAAKCLSEQFGVGVRDKDDVRRVCREKGFRLGEKGDEGDRVRKDLREWKKAGGAAAGLPLPDSCRPAPTRNPLDAVSIYRQIVRQGREER